MSAIHRTELTAIAGAAGGVGIVSLPIPRDAGPVVTVAGRPVQAVPVGYWPRSERTAGGPRAPRRALIFFDATAGDDALPIELREDVDAPTGAAACDTGWRVSVRALESSSERTTETHWCYLRETDEVTLAHGGREVGVRLAIDNEHGRHLWQYVVVEPLWSGPICDGYRIGGHIYTGDDHHLTREEVGRVSKWGVYRDDMIAASIYLLAFADGTVQATAHWINGRIYGGSADQTGLPVVVLRVREPDVAADGRTWTGDDPAIAFDGGTIDLSPAAHLVSEANAARISVDEEILAWRPFASTRVVMRHRPQDNGDVTDIAVANSEAGLVTGAARSASWLMKIGTGTPAVRRYLAPAEWYARCEEFAPMPIELRRGRWEALSRNAAGAFLRNSVSGSFTSGGIYRYLDQYGKGSYELSMDGNECRSVYRRAYFDGDAALYDLAARNAYCMADLAVDHAHDVVHYHGDSPEWRIFSLIYQRFPGIVYGYLETGDPYLLETTEAVARNYMSQHFQNWPRRGIGRDADPLAGFLTLWDYTAKEEYFEFARTMAGHIASVIDDGGVWLSGSGVGPHMGCNADLGSPWNGGHLLHGFVEYAMRDPEAAADVLVAGGRALRHIQEMLFERPDGFHPAACGFAGRTHWYLACRLRDPELIANARRIMDNILTNAEQGPIFSGGRAHHINNYIDYLLFYEATRDTLAGQV